MPTFNVVANSLVMEPSPREESRPIAGVSVHITCYKCNRAFRLMHATLDPDVLVEKVKDPRNHESRCPLIRQEVVL